jgi:polyhydroxyalkanoate synthesis regulator phasin
MMNSIRRALLAGVGAALITKEKAEETLNDFVQQGRVSAKDAKVMARQLAKDGKREFASVRSDVEDKLLDLTKRAGVEAQARIAALEARVAELQKQKQAGRKPASRPKAKAKGA